MRKLLIGIIICLMLLVPSVVSISINNTSLSKNGNILYVRGDGWNIETVNLYDHPRRTNIALDSRNIPHICYYEYGSLNLKYAKRRGSYWDIEVVDSPVTCYNSLVLDSNDIPHIAYMVYSEGQPSLRYAKRTKSGWSIDDVDTDRYIRGEIALALNSNDTPYISYRASHDNEESYSHTYLCCVWLNESRWETETVSTFCGFENSIAIDSNDNIAIAFGKYYQTPSGYDEHLTYAIRDLKGWNIYEVDPSEYQSGSISLGFDSENRPHISYGVCTFDGGLIFSDVFYILKYARLLNDNWELYIVDDTKGQNGFKNSLAIDSHDRPFISYSYDIENSLFFKRWELRFASFVDEVSELYWITCLIDVGGESHGLYNSLAFDSMDNPHVSYFGRTEYGALMYAKRIGTFVVSIDEPDRGYIYKFGEKNRTFFNGHTIVIGHVTVKVKANRKIQKVDFYLDDKLKCSVNNEPFSWYWSYCPFLRHTIKIVATDFSGSIASDRNMVWKFF